MNFDLAYPFDAQFQRSQPSFVVDEQLIGKSPGSTGRYILKTAMDVEHRFAPIMSLSAYLKAASRKLQADARLKLLQALPAIAVEMQSDPLVYFAGYLVDGFRQRDFGADQAQQPADDHPIGIVNWNQIVDSTLHDLPLPRLNQPSMFLSGRLWSLVPDQPQAGLWQLRDESHCWRINASMSISMARSLWLNEVNSYLRSIVCKISCPGELYQAAKVLNARREFEEHGHVERGDLLYLQTDGPRLGHILPPHFNRVFGCHVERILAITAPFAVPPLIPSVSHLQVVVKDSGRWQPYSPPHGLCLGDNAYVEESFLSPGVRLGAYLRWAAHRIAVNEMFHSSDGS